MLWNVILLRVVTKNLVRKWDGCQLAMNTLNTIEITWLIIYKGKFHVTGFSRPTLPRGLHSLVVLQKLDVMRPVKLIAWANILHVAYLSNFIYIKRYSNTFTLFIFYIFWFCKCWLNWIGKFYGNRTGSKDLMSSHWIKEKFGCIYAVFSERNITLKWSKLNTTNFKLKLAIRTLGSIDMEHHYQNLTISYRFWIFKV